VVSGEQLKRQSRISPKRGEAVIRQNCWLGQEILQDEYDPKEKKKGTNEPPPVQKKNVDLKEKSSRKQIEHRRFSTGSGKRLPKGKLVCRKKNIMGAERGKNPSRAQGGAERGIKRGKKTAPLGQKTSD